MLPWENGIVKSVCKELSTLKMMRIQRMLNDTRSTHVDSIRSAS